MRWFLACWAKSENAAGATSWLCGTGFSDRRRSQASPGYGPRARAPAADLDPRSIPSFASLPAVDGVNAKLQGFGGGWATDNRHLSRDNDDFRGAGGALGSLTVPLGQQFGFQADGMLASIGGDAAAGAAGHLFWRDPMRGLIGAYGSWTYWDRNGGLNAYRIGIESEAYFQRFTLSGVLGVEAGDSGTRYLTSFTTSFGTSDFFERYDIKTRFFDRLDLSITLRTISNCRSAIATAPESMPGPPPQSF